MEIDRAIISDATMPFHREPTKAGPEGDLAGFHLLRPSPNVKSQRSRQRRVPLSVVNGEIRAFHHAPGELISRNWPKKPGQFVFGDWLTLLAFAARNANQSKCKNAQD